MNSYKTKKGTDLPILNLKGKAYLQVAYRILWFREEKSDWSIETDFMAQGDAFAIAKAIIKDSSGRIMATAHKKEEKTHFPDFIEKAETGAIGRCLALVGYGTQFAEDLDEGERIVDSPLPSKSSVSPSQPGPDDGVINHPAMGYRVPMGKFKGLSLEEIPVEALRSYVNWIEGQAIEKKKPLQGDGLDFVERAVQYLVALEGV